MRRKGIKNLIFDFGGVLINLNRQCCIDSFKALGLSHVENLIDPFAQQGIFMQLEKGLITLAEFRDQIREQIGKPVTDEQIDGAWNNFLVDLPTYKLEALLKLRERYLVYLLSNTNQIHWDWSREHVFPYKGFHEKDYFEEIFLSYEMNLAKPDVAIFEAVLEATGIQAKDTFFIDDSEANCKSAESLGISTYLCKPGEDWTILFK